MFNVQYKVNRISNANLKWFLSYIKPNSKSFTNITCWLCPSEKGHDKWAAHCSNVLIQSFFFSYFPDLLCRFTKIPKTLRPTIFGHQIAIHFSALEYVPTMFYLPIGQPIFWLSRYADNFGKLCFPCCARD